ncbi:glycosyltransferase [Halobacillus sp. BAB-2008]|uniref:glycosyltransferase n=1 Tax=Halobacillus sp. BAB-2008 TaxID=1246484 RepID=UPI0002A4EDE1|nr:glycosyltransferase [Halobacillus sp. BAB-2008]ELK44182.1 glycosyltransferase 28 domain-containing protein [Halobacillus sp. BAB-2008]
MIFVSLGTQRFRFDRLIHKLDNLCELGVVREKVIVQSGGYHYKVSSENFVFKDFLSIEEMQKFIQSSEVTILHGGTGSIITCLKGKKKPIVVPRLKKYGEHIDDHQQEIAQLFNSKELIEVVNDMEELNERINSVRNVVFTDSLPFDNGVEITNDIREYLHSIGENM